MAIKTQYDNFKYHVILCDLSNATAIFQEYVKKIFIEKHDIFVIVYLNNILIYTKDLGQPHVKAVY